VKWEVSKKNPLTGRESGLWKLAKIASNGEASYLLTHNLIKGPHGIKLMWFPTAQEAMSHAEQVEQGRRASITNALEIEA